MFLFVYEIKFYLNNFPRITENRLSTRECVQKKIETQNYSIFCRVFELSKYQSNRRNDAESRLGVYEPISYDKFVSYLMMYFMYDF